MKRIERNSCSRLCIAFICIIILIGTFQIMMFKKYKLRYKDQPVAIKKHLPCQKDVFKDVLLVLVYHYAYYETIPMVKSNYEGAFPHIVVCGPVANSMYNIMVVNLHKGFFGYECVGKAIRLHPGFRGYLYINDDVILNWWNFVNLDRDKVWIGAPMDCRVGFKVNTRPIPLPWVGWNWLNLAKNCEAAFRKIKSFNKTTVFANAMSVHYSNTKNLTICLRTWSDLFYVPGKRADVFQQLSAVLFKHQVFLSIGVGTSLSMLDSCENWEKPYGIYLPDKYSTARLRSNSSLGWREYSESVYFIHPLKFHKNEENSKRLKDRVIALSNKKTKC